MNKYTHQVPIHNIETKEMHAVGFDLLDLEGRGGKTYDSSQLHRHTFFELFVFTGGKGDHEIDFMHYPVTKNAVHFVSPGQIHKLRLDRTRGYVFCFTEEFMLLPVTENFVEKFPFYDDASHPVLSLDKLPQTDLPALVSTIANEFRSTGDMDILRSYLNILLLKLKSVFTQEQDAITKRPGKSARVIRFKTLLNEQFLLHKPVSEYAAELNISPNHLNALCKQHEGKSAIQMLQDRLSLEAKRLLYATDLNVKEIAFELRFEDVAYFNRFFKKQTGSTPVQYREHSRKKSLKSTNT